MEITIKKWGNSLEENSLGAKLPKSLLQSMKVKEGDVLKIENNAQGEWVLKPKKAEYDFYDLLAEHDPEPYAWDTHAAGKEAL